jgi:hypothetical protein
LKPATLTKVVCARALWSGCVLRHARALRIVMDEVNQSDDATSVLAPTAELT